MVKLIRQHDGGRTRSWSPVAIPGAVDVLAKGLLPALPVTKRGVTGITSDAACLWQL
jgi:hypothetical protein